MDKTFRSNQFFCYVVLFLLLIPVTPYCKAMEEDSSEQEMGVVENERIFSSWKEKLKVIWRTKTYREYILLAAFGACFSAGSLLHVEWLGWGCSPVNSTDI